MEEEGKRIGQKKKKKRPIQALSAGEGQRGPQGRADGEVGQLEECPLKIERLKISASRRTMWNRILRDPTYVIHNSERHE